MKLTLKAVRFVTGALENYQKDHGRRLADESLSENDISDLTNDRLYLSAIKRDFETYRDQLVRDREGAGADA